MKREEEKARGKQHGWEQRVAKLWFSQPMKDQVRRVQEASQSSLSTATGPCGLKGKCWETKRDACLCWKTGNWVNFVDMVVNAHE